MNKENITMTLTTQDRLEIQDLMGRFTLAVDVKGPDAMVDVFTSDARFMVAAFELDITGRDNLIQWMKESADGFPPGLHHVLTNFVIEGEGETARLQCVSQAIQSHEGEIKHFAIGRYDETLVKTDLGWRLKEHQLFLS